MHLYLPVAAGGREIKSTLVQIVEESAQLVFGESRNTYQRSLTSNKICFYMASIYLYASSYQSQREVERSSPLSYR